MLTFVSGTFYSDHLLIPDKYKGNPPRAVAVLFLEPSEIDKACGNKNPATRYIACETDEGLMIVPNPCDYPEYKDPDSYARTMCHEKAHVMGWRHPAP